MGGWGAIRRGIGIFINMIPTKIRGEIRKPYLLKKSKNAREEFVQNLYYKAGWVVLKNGWPDLFCYNPKTGEIELVEVKALSQYEVKKIGKKTRRKLGRTQDQMRMHQYLEKAGFKVKVIHVE